MGNPFRRLDLMTSREAYDAGYADGEANVEADLDILCDQLDIEYDGHPITALRAEIQRLRESAASREEDDK